VERKPKDVTNKRSCEVNAISGSHARTLRAREFRFLHSHLAVTAQADHPNEKNQAASSMFKRENFSFPRQGRRVLEFVRPPREESREEGIQKSNGVPAGSRGGSKRKIGISPQKGKEDGDGRTWRIGIDLWFRLRP